LGRAVSADPLRHGTFFAFFADRRNIMNDRDTQNDRDRIQDKSWEPSAPSAEEELKTEARSLDIGESGQFAPGGYYNQQGVNQPDRSALDPDDKSDKF
jgi:hypothetical protein